MVVGLNVQMAEECIALRRIVQKLTGRKWDAEKLCLMGAGEPEGVEASEKPRPRETQASQATRKQSQDDPRDKGATSAQGDDSSTHEAVALSDKQVFKSGGSVERVETVSEYRRRIDPGPLPLDE